MILDQKRQYYHESLHHWAVVIAWEVILVRLHDLEHLGEHIHIVHIVHVVHSVVTLGVHHFFHDHLHHFFGSTVAVITVVVSSASMSGRVVIFVMFSKRFHHLHHHHHFHHLHQVILIVVALAIPVVIIGHADQVVCEPVEVSEGGKLGLRGVHLETLGHSLLHVEGVELHVLLAPAALHRLGLGPLHEHLPVRASIDADSGDNY